MKPDQAISKVAHEAVDLLEAYAANGGDGDPQQMVNCLYASINGLMLAAGMYEMELMNPGHIAGLDAKRQAALMGEAHAAAAGVLMVCSLLPGVDSLVPPVAH